MRGLRFVLLAAHFLVAIAFVSRAGPPPPEISFDDDFESGSLGPPNWLSPDVKNLDVSSDFKLVKTGDVALGRGSPKATKTGNPHKVEFSATGVTLLPTGVELGKTHAMVAVTLRVERDSEVVFGTVMAYLDENGDVKVKLLLGALDSSGEFDTNITPNPGEGPVAGDPLSGDLVLTVNETDAQLTFETASLSQAGFSDSEIKDLWVEIQGAYSDSAKGPSIDALSADNPP